MELIGRFGVLRIAEDKDMVRVTRNGDVIFEGPVEEFADVLERHKRFMDYIDSQEG